MPKKVDSNQAEIVAALRAAGCSVRSTAMVGSGFPDLVVGYKRRTYLLECKRENLPPSKYLTDDEIKFGLTWRGQHAIVHNVREALAVVGVESKDLA